jgi:hypothetical protein
MKKDQVEIGVTYVAKVSNKLVHVRLDKENPRGGWDGTNIATSRPVRIKSAQRLRGPAPKAKAGKEEPQVEEQLEADEPETQHLQAEGEQEVTTAETIEGNGAADNTTGGAEASVEKPAKEKKPRAKRDKKPVGEKGPKPLSCLDAAEVVLKAGGEPMACKAMIDAMVEKELWKTNAPTPAATLYSAILREITKKGDKSRFRKTDRGLFALTDHATR